MDTSLARIFDPIPSLSRRENFRPINNAKVSHGIMQKQDKQIPKPVEIDQSFDPRGLNDNASARHTGNRGLYDLADRSFEAVEPLREFIGGRWQKRKVQLRMSD